MKLIVATLGELIAIVVLAGIIFKCWEGIDQYIFSLL
jgi:hypothetical protein